MASAQQAVDVSLEGDLARAHSLLDQAAQRREQFRTAYAAYQTAVGGPWVPPTGPSLTTPRTVVTTTEPTASTATPTPYPQASFTEYVRLTTWYSAADGDDCAWVHFKTVDDGGYTVEDALGSDIINTATEKNAMAETVRRRELVDKLRDLMTAAGWTELGFEGDWYLYVFER